MRTTRWYGKLLGFLAGAALLRAEPPLGALLGLLIGHAFDADWFRLRDDPYRTLGISDEANDAEIQQAWRRLMSQYHPDKFATAAPELRQRAEKRTREINAAYDRIQAMRRPAR
ncbi:J domain-containing protein [Cognatilysobacter segetis]|uniref:J domain-containing protein n=1 Tax=Cognatilysobacter segetis TaxID=2492394 RepID=UPI00105DBA2F|nr:DnaJ domain-containing protein [Lysobacter segetis]